MLNGTTINSSNNRKNLKKLCLNDFKRRNKFKSYLLKEIKTLVRTPIFCLQCLIMPIIYPITVFLLMAIFINFANRIGIDALSEFYNRIMTTWGIAVFLSIGQVFYMMNFSSIIAISREANNSIFFKYIPLNFKAQFNLKIQIGTFVNLISGILVSYSYYVVIKNILYTVLFFVILFFMNIIGEKVKLLIDLKNPQVTWDSEYTMMKQNTNVMYELFYTLIVIGIFIGLSNFILNFEVFFILILIICITTNLLISEYIYNNKEKLMKKIL